MKQTIVGFGLLVFGVLLLVQFAKFTHFQSDLAFELWIVFFSILFLILGIFLSKKMSPPRIIKEKVIVNQSTFQLDRDQLTKYNISKREFEILQLITNGLSNQQIAENLFLSESTIKKHVSNLFFKLDVQRRTEAVKKAKELNLVA